MKYYKVTQRYYDTGKNTAEISEVDANDLPDAEFHHTAHADVYVDFFSDKASAEDCKEMTLKV